MEVLPYLIYIKKPCRFCSWYFVVK